MFKIRLLLGEIIVLNIFVSESKYLVVLAVH